MPLEASDSTDNLYSLRQLILLTILSGGYLLLSRWLIGFRMEQVWLAILFNTFYFSSHATRRFIKGFSIFFLFWIIFDYMKAFPNYQYNSVHIGSLYHAEKALFGIHSGGKFMTPNEYWLQHPHPVWDIVTGLFYLCWVPVPLAFAAYLFFKDKLLFLRFSLTFLLVNIIGFFIYYLYPAAPPWYVQQHGFILITETPGFTAGLARFDQLTGLTIFASLYGHSSNVFAAMPSLHAAYPLIVYFFVVKTKPGWLVGSLFFLLMPGIWFSAVYTSHHYILDVLAGIACALAGIGLFAWMESGNEYFKRFLQMFVRAIT